MMSPSWQRTSNSPLHNHIVGHFSMPYLGQRATTCHWGNLIALSSLSYVVVTSTAKLNYSCWVTSLRVFGPFLRQTTWTVHSVHTTSLFGFIVMPLTAYMHIHTLVTTALALLQNCKRPPERFPIKSWIARIFASLTGPCTTSLFSLVVVVHVTSLHIRPLTHDYLGHSHSPTLFDVIIVLFPSTLSHRIIHHFRCCSRLCVSASVPEPLLSPDFIHSLRVVRHIAHSSLSFHACDFQL